MKCYILSITILFLMLSACLSLGEEEKSFIKNGFQKNCLLINGANGISANSIKYRVCTECLHKWPEAVDIGKAGNLYFSDAVEKALYRIRVNRNSGEFVEREEKLLEGLKHAGGISIDKDNNHLYFGIRDKGSKNIKEMIVQIPLDNCQHGQINLLLLRS